MSFESEEHVIEAPRILTNLLSEEPSSRERSEAGEVTCWTQEMTRVWRGFKEAGGNDC